MLTVQHTCLCFQSLLRANIHVRTLIDADDVWLTCQHTHDLWLPSFNPRREELAHDEPGIAIRDESRHAVALGIHPAQCVCSFGQRFASSDRFRNAPMEELAVDAFSFIQ